MDPYLRQEFGNPSNLYRIGRRAADAVERARASVARALGCRVVVSTDAHSVREQLVRYEHLGLSVSPNLLRRFGLENPPV